MSAAKTINSLFELKKSTPPALQDEPMSFSPTGRQTDFFDIPSSQLLQRGEVFFDRIYGRIASRVVSIIFLSSTCAFDLDVIYRGCSAPISRTDPIFSRRMSRWVEWIEVAQRTLACR